MAIWEEPRSKMPADVRALKTLESASHRVTSSLAPFGEGGKLPLVDSNRGVNQGQYQPLSLTLPSSSSVEVAGWCTLIPQRSIARSTAAPRISSAMPVLSVNGWA